MSNLTGRPVYQKGIKRKSRAKARPANTKERAYWRRVLRVGCVVGPAGCAGRMTVHHCGTGGGGRKDHMKVVGLCWEHHLGKQGVDGKRMSRRKWQEIYGPEEILLKRVERRLAHADKTGE